MKLINDMNPQPVTEYGIWQRRMQHIQAVFQQFNPKRTIIKVIQVERTL